ncbi:unnamed protein product [Phaeothamnion confervicola]
MAKNVRAMAGDLPPVKGGLGADDDPGTAASPEDPQELRRLQAEINHHLQRGGIVTTVDPDDKPVPYWLQGGIAVNTPESVRLRHRLRNSPLIREIIDEYYAFPELGLAAAAIAAAEAAGTASAYSLLNRKLHLALVPDVAPEAAAAAATADWERDTQPLGGVLTHRAFYRSLFELADIWTENISEEEYAAFLWLLLESVTDKAVVPRRFRPDADIRGIVDADMEQVSRC